MSEALQEDNGSADRVARDGLHEFSIHVKSLKLFLRGTVEMKIKANFRNKAEAWEFATRQPFFVGTYEITMVKSRCGTVFSSTFIKLG